MKTAPTKKELTLSIIIERENILLAKYSRVLRMINELSEQITELKEIDQNGKLSPRQKRFIKRFKLPIEVMVVFGESEVAQSLLEEIFMKFMGDNPRINLRFEPVKDIHYYAFKNHGAKQTKADYVLFLDSDVILTITGFASFYVRFKIPRLMWWPATRISNR